MGYAAMMNYRLAGQKKFKEKKYGEAKRLLEMALKETESYRPPNAYTAEQLKTVGVFHFALREYAKAEPYFKNSLAIEQSLVEPENLRIANGFNHLGLLYQVWGKNAEAERAFKQAMAYKSRSQLLSHRQANSSLLRMSRNHLAMLYCAQNLRDEAMSLCEKSTGKRRKSGADFPSDLHELAMRYCKRNCEKEAHKACRKSGADFPSDLHELAMRYCKRNCEKEAHKACAWQLEFACEELQREYLDACAPDVTLAGRKLRAQSGAIEPAFDLDGAADDAWRPSMVYRDDTAMLTAFQQSGSRYERVNELIAGAGPGWRPLQASSAKKN